MYPKCFGIQREMLRDFFGTAQGRDFGCYLFRILDDKEDTKF